MFTRNSSSNDVPNYHDACGYADSRFERLSIGTFQLLEAINNRERGINGTFGCILLRLRITKISEHPIAHELGDKAVKRRNCTRTCVLIAPDERTHFFRINLVSQRSRTHQIRKQHRDLTSLRFLFGHEWRCFRFVLNRL